MRLLGLHALKWESVERSQGEWYTDNQNCYQVQPGTFQCRISNCAWKQDQMTDVRPGCPASYCCALSVLPCYAPRNEDSNRRAVDIGMVGQAVSHHGAKAQFFNGDRFNSYQTVWVNDFYAPDVKMYTHHWTEKKKCKFLCMWSCDMCDDPKSKDINWDERANSVKIA